MRIDRPSAIVECYILLNEIGKLGIAKEDPELVEYHRVRIKQMVQDILQYLREEGVCDYNPQLEPRGTGAVFNGIGDIARAYEQGKRQALARGKVHPILAAPDSSSQKE